MIATYKEHLEREGTNRIPLKTFDDQTEVTCGGQATPLDVKLRDVPQFRKYGLQV